MIVQKPHTILHGQNTGLTGFPPPASSRKVFRTIQNERTAGSMPVWESAVSTNETSKQAIEQRLAFAQSGLPLSPEAPDSTLAYSPSDSSQNPAAPEEFGFGDLLDMVNPLQHIPVVGHLYRSLTGDQIRPIGEIIGGAVFGGPLGAASGLVNAVIEEETGKDLSGNALAFVLEGDSPHYTNTLNLGPEARLSAVPVPTQTAPPAVFAEPEDYDPLPGNLLSFVDLKAHQGIIIERKRTS